MKKRLFIIFVFLVAISIIIPYIKLSKVKNINKIGKKLSEHSDKLLYLYQKDNYDNIYNEFVDSIVVAKDDFLLQLSELHSGFGRIESYRNIGSYAQSQKDKGYSKLTVKYLLEFKNKSYGDAFFHFLIDKELSKINEQISYFEFYNDDTNKLIRVKLSHIE